VLSFGSIPAWPFETGVMQEQNDEITQFLLFGNDFHSCGCTADAVDVVIVLGSACAVCM